MNKNNTRIALLGAGPLHKKILNKIRKNKKNLHVILTDDLEKAQFIVYFPSESDTEDTLVELINRLNFRNNFYAIKTSFEVPLGIKQIVFNPEEHNPFMPTLPSRQCAKSTHLLITILNKSYVRNSKYKKKIRTISAPIKATFKRVRTVYSKIRAESVG